MSWQPEIDEIKKVSALATQQGGKKNIARQHAKGRLTIRERISSLLDKGTFQEIGPGAGARQTDENGNLVSFSPANFLLGFGKIEDRLCVVCGEDFTVSGGSPNAAGLRKSIYAEHLAFQHRIPLIRLHEGGGGSVGGTGKQNATVGTAVYEPHRFRPVAEAMATVPVVTAALGPVAGLPAARLVAAHLSVMARKNAQVLIAGPAVVERALGEKKTKEELGGAAVHTKNGVIDNIADDEVDAFKQIRTFLSYLPTNVGELPPVVISDDPRDRTEIILRDIIPKERRKLYKVRDVIFAVIDQNSFFEIGSEYGRGQLTGLARLNGQPVGIWANNCRYLAGSMTALGARKARRFIEFCETFHVPIVCFVDEPGFMIGSKAEQEGTIRDGTATVLAASMSTVPWASIVIRRSFGVAQAAHYGQNAYVLAWPSAEIGALPVEGGVAVAYHREIAAAADPDAKRAELEALLAEKQSPMPRGESFSLHEIIDPADTRSRLCDWIDWIQPTMPELIGPTSFSIRP